MSNYVVVDKEYLDDGLSKVADAIKAKSGNSEDMTFPDGFKERINSIPESYWSEEDIFNLLSENRSTIQSLRLPDGITTIPQYFFYGLSDLKVSQLPDSIESIGNSAFQDCTNLCLEKLPNNLKTIGAYAFRQAVIYISELPEGLETIGNYAFLNRSGLTIKSIPASVKVLNTSCFQGCPNLTEITFKGTPDTIAANAFNSCTNLAVINVPWAEGEVANARWGAPDTTVINYNYIEETGE